MVAQWLVQWRTLGGIVELEFVFLKLEFVFSKLEFVFSKLEFVFLKLEFVFSKLEFVFSKLEFDIPSIIFERFAYLKPTPKAYMLKISRPPPPPNISRSVRHWVSTCVLHLSEDH